MFCKYCGCKNADEVKFCKKCGKGIALDPLTESSSTTNNTSQETPLIISGHTTENPSIRDREIVSCNSIKHMNNHMKKVTLYWIIYIVLSAIIFTILGVCLVQLIYSCMNPTQQIYLKYTLRITPIGVTIIPVGLLVLFDVWIYIQMRKAVSNITHEHLHITDRGIWGANGLNGEFSCRFDEIKTVTKSNKVPFVIRKANMHLPMDGHFLTIELYDSQVFQYMLIGKEQILLVYTTLQPLVGKFKK